VHYQCAICFRIISVGGDGMFSEILNGILMQEEQNVQASSSTAFNPQKPNIKLGIIPAGMYLKIYFIFETFTVVPIEVFLKY
jgi:hypothetical protein